MIENILHHLDLPEACHVNKVIYKKSFAENGLLNAADKKALNSDVHKIHCLSVLKPETSHIDAFADTQRDYGEILVLSVRLHCAKKYERIAGFVHKSIPYPVLLIMAHEAQIALSTAHKRINQADHSKTVVEDIILTDWLTPKPTNTAVQDFLVSLDIATMAGTHMLALYNDITARLVAYNCAAYSGQFSLPAHDDATRKRLEQIKTIKALLADKKAKQKQLNKTSQMGKQVAIMQEIKHITTQIDILKQHL